jgi:hypothetical protein
MTATTSDVLAGNESALAGKGLELLHAMIDHLIPSDMVALPDIFKEWHELAQKKHAVVFGDSVSKLAARSKQAGQEHADTSYILTFVEGLHDSFADVPRTASRDESNSMRQASPTPRPSPRSWSAP